MSNRYQREKITCIGCDFNFYTIITNNGKTYSWSSNCHDQLSNPRLESTGDFLKELCEIELSDKTTDICFSSKHNLIDIKMYGYIENLWLQAVCISI